MTGTIYIHEPLQLTPHLILDNPKIPPIDMEATRTYQYLLSGAVLSRSDEQDMIKYFKNILARTKQIADLWDSKKNSRRI